MLVPKLAANEAVVNFRAGRLGAASAEDLVRAEISPDEMGQDFLQVMAVMCHADVANNNGDGFLEEDLHWALNDYGIFTLYRPGMMDDAHDRIPYGIWSGAYAIHHRDRMAITTDGVIFAWRFPEFAEHVSSLYEQSNLWFSMLCRYAAGRCSECGQEYTPDEFEANAICEHLKGRPYNGVTRWLKRPVFLTSSRVDRPADEDAEGLIAASDETLDDFVVPASAAEFDGLPHAERVSLYYDLFDTAPTYR